MNKLFLITLRRNYCKMFRTNLWGHVAFSANAIGCWNIYRIVDNIVPYSQTEVPNHARKIALHQYIFRFQISVRYSRLAWNDFLNVAIIHKSLLMTKN